MFFSRTRTSPPARAKLPPVLPSDNRFLGHLGMMREDPLGLFLRAQEEYGNILRARFGHKWAYFLNHPDYAHHVLVSNIDNYTKDTRGYEKLRLALGNGLVTSQGAFWRRQRRIAQPAFHRKRLEGFVQMMQESTQDMLQSWDEHVANGRSIDIVREMMRLTLGIAGKTLFHQDLSKDTDNFGKALTTVLEHFPWVVSSPIPFAEFLPTRANFHAIKSIITMNRLIDKMIAERRRDPADRGDLLSMFMLARDEETGEGMTDKQLRAEALTMLSAGHETTANAMSWTFYLLSQHPEVQHKIEAELDEVLGGRTPTFQDLRDLTYTTQVFKESMRLYPPVWGLARLSKHEDEIDGYHIPAEQFVFIVPYAIHRNPDFWPNPNKFDPERFSPENLEAQKALGHSRFAYLPFSLGQRKCIGDHFATMEAQILLAIILQRFRLQLIPGQTITPQASVTLRPKHGIRMTLSPR